MVLLKRKPVLFTPLPSLSTVLQPLQTDSTSSPAPGPGSPSKDSTSNTNNPGEGGSAIPPDGKDDDEQLDKLLSIFRGEFAGASGNVGPGKGKKAGTRLVNPPAVNGVKANGHAVVATAGEVPTPGQEGEGQGEQNVIWRIWDRECFYLPETGEIFTDYESYLARVTFYQQSLFQCEVSSKSALSYYAAQSSEHREARQLHTRFPKPLKKAVLNAVQFQIEGKLDNLADKVYERFVNRFFDDERVFVDVEGDKYLARIVQTFPPRNLASSSQNNAQPIYHPYASDLEIPIEELNERDDPMSYIYHVRLIEEGAPEGVVADYGSANGHSNGGGGDEDGETWQGSTMEIHADKLSRDRINFSRTMLKRFIRDCVVRESAVYSPWIVKSSVAHRYGIPTEMPEEVKERHVRYRERQMDKRKREREERLGITHGDSEADPAHVATEDEKPTKKSKKQKKEEEVKEEKEEVKKKAMKYPAEDLLVEYAPEKDGPAGRIQIRPSPNTSLPFADQFERFLMSWSFLNVMGKPLGLSPFSLDDFESALYHNDPWTSPTPLMVEIHATLLNSLIADASAGNDAVKALAQTSESEENDTDYWEGKKGATAETLRPVAGAMADHWKDKELSLRDTRKGWESALVGCLWERATLETLPNYLDHVLHLTFEDKPAPTRPTWSTGPSQSSGNGLIPSKPEKRYSTLHHLHKLEIISFLTELVSQTAAVRDFMEESIAALTEVRKDQVEVKREWKRLHVELLALDPKKPKDEENGDGPTDADGDISMDQLNALKEDRAVSPDISVIASVNGLINGTATNTERDELDSSPAVDDGTDDDDDPLTDLEDGNPNVTAASRRKAMKERAAEREAEEAERAAKVAAERAKKTESKQLSAERKRLADELDVLAHRLRQLDFDFRSHIHTLRARPLGLDRFGNKVWWLDGLGSAPLVNDSGKPILGTGRIYVQGVDDVDLELIRLPVGEEASKELVESRREKEEGGGRLKPGEWGSYDTEEQLRDFISWLNPRGHRELALFKAFNGWLSEITLGMHRRRIAAGLEAVPESEEPVKRNRPVRKVVAAGGMGGDDEGVGYMGWKNRRARV